MGVDRRGRLLVKRSDRHAVGELEHSARRHERGLQDVGRGKVGAAHLRARPRPGPPENARRPRRAFWRRPMASRSGGSRASPGNRPGRRGPTSGSRRSSRSRRSGSRAPGSLVGRPRTSPRWWQHHRDERRISPRRRFGSARPRPGPTVMNRGPARCDVSDHVRVRRAGERCPRRGRHVSSHGRRRATRSAGHRPDSPIPQSQARRRLGRGRARLHLLDRRWQCQPRPGSSPRSSPPRRPRWAPRRDHAQATALSAP